MQGLVKFICSMLLMFVAITWTDQENMEPQEAMQLKQRICSFQAGLSSVERTTLHLYAEKLAMPISIVGDQPGYHPQHSKPKCLHLTHHSGKYVSQKTAIQFVGHLQTPFLFHVIDYYIYTLEHILI